MDQPGNKETVQDFGPVQDSWCLSLREPTVGIALELRFSILISKNGFHRSAETWGMYFEKTPGKNSLKTVIKETHDLSKFVREANGFQLANCRFTNTSCTGAIHSKGQMMEWDLQFKPRQAASFDFIPTSLKKISLIKTARVTPQPDLVFTGYVKVNDRKIEINQALGLQTHQYGQRNLHSWISGYANKFKNEQGVEIPFLIEAVSFKNFLLGNIPSPRVSSFYFIYEDKTYFFNSIRDAVHLRSKSSLSDWSFRAEKGDLVFQGSFSFELKDFAGISYEDTNGSVIYCSSSKFSDLKIQIYDQGKLKAALSAQQNASIEIVSRKKSPYVQVLN